MEMTLEQYILNPMGKNNAVLNSFVRENLRKSYMVKFDNILLREHSKIEYYLYKDTKSNTYWAHIKIPSEVVKNFYYDIVIKFFTNEKVDQGGQNLFKYNVKFYSNDPAFVFTYANVFFTNDLFIKELASKMSKTALKKAPVEKNPSKDIGYVKSIYFAYLLLQNRKLNMITKFNAEAKPLNLNYLLNSIEDADIKVRKRQEEGEKISSRKKITLDKRTAQKVQNIVKDNNYISQRINVATTKSVGKIKNKATVSKVKNVGSIKKK